METLIRTSRSRAARGRQSAGSRPFPPSGSAFSGHALGIAQPRPGHDFGTAGPAARSAQPHRRDVGACARAAGKRSWKSTEQQRTGRRARILQWLRRFRRERNGVCHGSRQGRDDAGTLGQRGANPNFGFPGGAEGGGYSWSDNSRDFQLTAWGNDAGQQSARRSLLCERRKQRGPFRPDDAADQGRPRRLYFAARDTDTAVSSTAPTRSECCSSNSPRSTIRSSWRA